ncbi:MAG: DUF3579 domain-containing protein [Herminiimonas sp.]|nr:DUF3579 domain-containing protein [Herminiimonas sp.]
MAEPDPVFAPVSPPSAPPPGAAATAPGGDCIIPGTTSNGQPFRPSDWAERLCGAMSCFRPEGYAGRNAHLLYSPYVRPTVLAGVKCVVVDEALRGVQPLAYHFVMDFARDNGLQVIRACLLPEPDPKI